MTNSAFLGLQTRAFNPLSFWPNVDALVPSRPLHGRLQESKSPLDGPAHALELAGVGVAPGFATQLFGVVSESGK